MAVPSVHSLSHIWNLDNGIVELTLNKNAFCFEMIDNDIVASASLNETIDFWNYHTGKLVISIQANASQVLLKQTSIPSNYLFSSDANGNISIWDTDTYSLVGTLKNHTKAVSGMVVLDNGQLVTASEDGWLLLWDVVNPVLLGSLSPFNNSIQSITKVTADTIAVGGLSNKVLIIKIDQQNRFNVINMTHVTDPNVIGLQLTYENILLIATGGGNVSFFDIFTYQLQQTVSVGSGLVAMDLYGKKEF
jgi:WD40 repeat protein